MDKLVGIAKKALLMVGILAAMCLLAYGLLLLILPDAAGTIAEGSPHLLGDIASAIGELVAALRISPLLDIALVVGCYVGVCLTFWVGSKIRTHVSHYHNFYE